MDPSSPIERGRLRALATKAYEHTPGVRSTIPEGHTVWSADVPLYSTRAFRAAGPYEAEYAAAAQNAALPLLDFIEHLLLELSALALVDTPAPMPAKKPRKKVPA